MIVEDEMISRRPALSAEKRALLEKRLRNGASKNGGWRPEIPRRASHGNTPLSFAQQRLWFCDQFEPDGSLYIMPVALRLGGPLNCEALHKAINSIVVRHEALRTRFQSENGSPVQMILESMPVELPVRDLSNTPEAQCADELWRLLDEEANRAFDLSRGGLLRTLLVRLDETDHVLMFTMHHIVSDAWSLGVLFRELAEFYEAFDSGGFPSLPELPVEYADFATWQRRQMQGEAMQRQLAFWKRQLVNAPHFLEMPTDKPRPQVQSFRGGHASRLLPKSLAGKLKRVGRTEGATMFMTLLAAFKVLLHRYTRQAQIVVGSPVAGRNQLETEGLIGFFVNTLALHTDLSGNPAFSELLSRVRQVTLDGFAHQDLPFEKLIEELQPARNPGLLPLVQVMFVFQNGMAQDLKMRGITIRPVEVATRTSKFDLTLVAGERPDGLMLQVEYNADLFSEATIIRLLGHFQMLLEGIAVDPSQRICELPMLTEAERQQILVDWNPPSGEETNFQSNLCIHQLFEEQVKRTPDAMAVSYENEAVTYLELDRRANHLAGHLRPLGIGPEVMVGLCVERSVEMVVAILAVLKAGGAYVPMDPAYPTERIAFTLQDARISVLLTQASLRDRFQSATSDLKLLCVDEQPETMDGNENRETVHTSAPKPRSPDAGPDNLAYVIYTSGSTGQPKGVMVTHRNVTRLFSATQPWYQFNERDVWTLFHSCAFDFSVWEIWGALLFGGRLVVVPYLTSRSPEEFLELLAREQVTVLNQTPSAFRQLIQAEQNHGRPSPLALRYVIFGGEALNLQNLKPWFERHGDQHPRLVNMYGITETTVHVTYRPLHADELNLGSPIGAPIPDLEMYILDERRQPVPVGVPGEMYVGGAGVARGYLNRPELSAERFIPNPFNREPGVRLYKTGDVARWRLDGDIEYLGRADNQVKIRGHRIELGEIESALARHPAVKEAVVLAKPDASGEKQLVAYAVPETDGGKLTGKIDAAVLRDFLRKKLPDYMIPTAFVQLESLPLNTNGKLDHKALPVFDRQAIPTGRKFLAPCDDVEARLAKIWEDVLNIQPIGVEDHFFDLGGHSLLAVRLAARIGMVFGRKLPVAAIFQSPTVRQLAGIIRKEEKTTGASSIVEIQPRGTLPPLFLVHGAGGGMIWGYTNLSRHLGPNQPLFAFSSRGLNGQEEFTSIEEMAAQYVADLLAFQPQGPYRLGGYCFGGDVAYEMARQLEAQGEKVALLALMNCAPPNSSYGRVRWTPLFVLKFAHNFYWFAIEALRGTAEERRVFLRWLKMNLIRLLKGRFGRRREAGVEKLVEEVEGSLELPFDVRGIWRTHLRALINYHPQSCSCRVTLFRSRAHPVLCSFDPQCGWGELATGGVSVTIVPGSHESILTEPHAHAVAAAMKECLDKLQAGQPENNQP
jgi:amino acid adenylation domain-containing protein